MTSKYDFHPITEEYDDFTEAERQKMRDSLKKIGLVTPIVIWKRQIVDGRHRELLCRELGIARRYDHITRRRPSEADMRGYVAACNEHRRSRTSPLTTEEKRSREEKRAAVKAELVNDPKRSDREIAEQTGTSHPFVSKIRESIGGGNVATPPSDRRSRTGKTGEGQHRNPKGGKPVPRAGAVITGGDPGYLPGRNPDELDRTPATDVAPGGDDRERAVADRRRRKQVEAEVKRIEKFLVNLNSQCETAELISDDVIPLLSEEQLELVVNGLTRPIETLKAVRRRVERAAKLDGANGVTETTIAAQPDPALCRFD